jgi:uncharacterized protein (TIGR03382 family)
VFKRTLILPLALCVAALAAPSVVWAKANGFPGDSCSGCHRGTEPFKPKLSADPAKIAPGESTTITIVIPGAFAGLYINSNMKGVFTELPGEGLKNVGDTGMTHTQPKSGQGGQVTFKVKWTAPNTGPGGVDFDVAAVSANGDNSSRGDTEGFGRLNFSYGCDGVDVYLDQDGDGWGLTDLRGPTRQCELKAGWTTKSGDCNDYDKNANPMGVEVCNLYDDDCDGMVNEGLENATVYKDEDGDGHGARFNAVMQVGCGNGLGWSSLRDDCDDMDRTIHPGAKEMCNYKDDNCNGRTDEGVRASCGVGWCRREAASCEANATCIPNAPRAEMCNGFDDDCDDVIDNGATCDGGKVCYKGTCLTSAEAGMMAAAEPPPPPDAGAPSNGGTSSGYGGSSGGPSGGNSSNSSGNGGSSGGANVGSSPAGSGDSGQPRAGCQYAGGGFGGGGVLGLGLAAALQLWRRRRRQRRERHGGLGAGGGPQR